MTLVLWVITATSFTRREFVNRLPLLSQLTEVKAFYQITICPGRSDRAGALNEHLSIFLHNKRHFGFFLHIAFRREINICNRKH